MGKKKRFWNGTAFGTIAKVVARAFAPHSFETKVEFAGGLPRILVTREALDRMYHYVDIADKEVGWLGTCRPDGRDFLIDRVFLFEQEVSHTSTEITVDGLAKFSEEILTQYPEDGIEILNSLRFWGHSHVNMGTTPSGTDERQMDLFAQSGHEFFIRAILNKNGRIEFTLYLYATGITLSDVEWGVITQPDERLREEIAAEMKAKVTERAWTQLPSYGPQGSWRDRLDSTAPQPIFRLPNQGGDF